MSECPYCQEPVEENAFFCRSCGASLRLPEYDRAFCPHCGARVSARQEFCHECHWSLTKGAAEEETVASEPPASIPGQPPVWKNPWIWGLLAGIGALILILPWLFLPSAPTPSPPPAPKVAAGKPVPVAPAPALPSSPPGEGAASATVVKEQLSELLQQLREAQLKKDISLYAQAFAPNFPDFDKRRQKTLAVWEAYDFNALDFEITEVKLLDISHVQAMVTWKLQIQQKAAQTGKSETQVYLVTFAKDEGKWRISTLELVRKPG